MLRKLWSDENYLSDSRSFLWVTQTHWYKKRRPSLLAAGNAVFELSFPPTIPQWGVPIPRTHVYLCRGHCRISWTLRSLDTSQLKFLDNSYQHLAYKIQTDSKLCITLLTNLQCPVGPTKKNNKGKVPLSECKPTLFGPEIPQLASFAEK